MVVQGKLIPFTSSQLSIYIHRDAKQRKKKLWADRFRFLLWVFHFKSTLKYIAVHAIKKTHTKVLFHIKYNTLKQYISSEFIHLTFFSSITLDELEDPGSNPDPIILSKLIQDVTLL